MYQDVRDQADIDLAIRRVVARLVSLRQNVKNHVLVSCPRGVLVHTRLQAMFNVKFASKTDQSIHEIIMGHATSAERLGPGSFDLCIEKLLEKLDSVRGSCQDLPSPRTLSDIVGSGAVTPSNSDVDWVLAEHLAGASPRTSAMLRQALDLAGFAGRVMVEKTHARPSVELIRGYTFEQAPAWALSARFEKPKVVCIDGYIEQVSELHHLLEVAAETKESVLLFIRGMSDDVKHTLKVNYDRGSLRVIPIIIKFDIEGINAINDIAIATGAELVSSSKGDLVSNIKLSESPHVDEVVVHMTKVMVVNTRSRRAVESHVAFLRKKRLDEKIDDVACLFDVRIKSLSPNHVVVRLPDDKDYVTSSQSIDYTLRAIKALVDHGSIIVDGKRTLTVTALASEVHSSRCLATLLSLGAMINQGS